VEAVAAIGIAEAGGARSILRAVEHDKFAVVKNDGGIESAGGFPGCALGRKDGLVRGALPSTEGEIVGLRGEGDGGREERDRKKEPGFSGMHDQPRRAERVDGHTKPRSELVCGHRRKKQKLNAESAENTEYAEKRKERV